LGTVGEFLGDFVGTRPQVSFGSFRLDIETRQLLADSDSRPVHLSPKAFELLCVLVKNRPKAISKADLHERLWPSVFVTDATLASLVRELREALGDRDRAVRFIRTVHGYGYAFAGTVRETPPPTMAPSTHWLVFNGGEKLLGPGEYLIGRDPDVTISLRSPTVSRHHAKIVIVGELATLEDLGSKNGTYVRGVVVTAPTLLADGDQLRIGAFDLTFRAVGSKGSTETLE
jgi:DNA-binding winged helix-turn-helix (wHTH) protein